jgi:effector-binding domain-containing protein
LKQLGIFLFAFSLVTCAFGYESMHEKTPVGEITLINLPERTALEARTDKSYFSEDNGLFRKLFRFINQNDISMTTPVEADINPGKMRFFVGNKDLSQKIKSSDQVKVLIIPSRKVVSIGIRGGYTQKRFKENLLRLNKWLDSNTTYESDGEPYGVYWNGPFVPGLLKRSEIHIPIRPAKNQPNENSSKPKSPKQK